MDLLSLYHTMRIIREFEERSLAEFAAGKLVGTTHTYIGQEANAAAIFQFVREEDVVWSNHRCHGHFLAYGGDPYQLAAELMGKATGLVAGRGGSQHVHWKNFFTNGIQGGIVPNAAGMALARKMDRSEGIGIVFVGDGTLGQGVVYETFNIASLWKIPLLIVVENNRYAQTTPTEIALSGRIADRFKAFGIERFELNTSDVTQILPKAEEAINIVRTEGIPFGLILNTHRFSAHSKGDDTRDKQQIKFLKENYDPLRILAEKLDSAAVLDLDNQAIERIDEAFKKAYADPFPSLNLAETQA